MVSFALTPGNVDDRKPVTILMKSVVDKVFGDAGYVSKDLAEHLVAQGIEWMISLKKT